MKINEREGIAGTWTEIEWEEKEITSDELTDLFNFAIKHAPEGMAGKTIEEAFEMAMEKQGL